MPYPIQNHKFSKRLSHAIAVLPFVVSPRKGGGYKVEMANGYIAWAFLDGPTEETTVMYAGMGMSDCLFKKAANPEAAADFIRGLAREKF